MALRRGRTSAAAVAAADDDDAVAADDDAVAAEHSESCSNYAVAESRGWRNSVWRWCSSASRSFERTESFADGTKPAAALQGSDIDDAGEPSR